MATIRIKSAFILRRGTAANWSEKNPILREGEEGYETDTGRRKVGDGTTEWNNLKYDSGIVDQTYNPDSENAQSGKAVAEAVADKEFELIEEITITEDTDVITRNTEPDGTAYNFSGIFAIVSFPAMTNDYNKVGVTMCLYDENNINVFGDRIRRDNQSLSQYEGQNWLPIGVLNVKGIQIPYVGQITTNRYYGFSAGLLSEPVFNKKFTKVTFTEASSVSKQFIAGTKISIYGVR